MIEFSDFHFDLSSIDKKEISLFIENTYGLFDLSRNLFNNKCVNIFNSLKENDFFIKIEQFFCENILNTTEKRAVGHLFLRDLNNSYCSNYHREIKQALDKMLEISESIRTHAYLTTSEKAVDTIINIGIGGSHLGVELVNQALEPFTDSNIQCHFLSNCDPDHFDRIIQKINFETTLVLVSSKSFITLETIVNYQKLKKLFDEKLGKDSKQHFIAITAKIDQAKQQGFDDERIIPTFDYIGGRFSVWSAVGLAILIKIGQKNFEKFLQGAYQADQDFRQPDKNKNLSVLLAIIDFCYANFFGITSRAIVPYTERLRLLPSYLQQLHMESLGKSVNYQGEPLKHRPGLVIWGEIGANSQHSFHQFFYQDQQIIPIDFLVSAKPSHSLEKDLQEVLVAQCLSQAEALWQGNLEDMDIHRQTTSKNPSSLFFLNCLDCETMGYLLATYENKVVAEALLAEINAFDQFGVELGKKLTLPVLRYLQGETKELSGSSELKAQLKYYLKKRNENC